MAPGYMYTSDRFLDNQGNLTISVHSQHHGIHGDNIYTIKWHYRAMQHLLKRLL